MNKTEIPAAENCPADSCVMVIFGATGDLTKRKLLPALYNLAQQNYLSESFAIVGVARKEMSDEEFRQKVVSPILDAWQNQSNGDVPNYAAGTWGPAESDEMLERDGRKWRNVIED